MAEIAELKNAYETEIKSLQEAVKAVVAETVIEDGNVKIPEKGYAEAKRLRKNISELEDLLAPEAKSVLEDMAADSTGHAARFFAGAAEQKSVASQLLDSDEYKDMIAAGRFEMSGDVHLDGSDIIQRKDVGVWTGLDEGTSPRGFGVVHQELPFVEPRRLLTRVRDLFPKASTTSNLLEYFKSVGWTAGVNPNNAAFVREVAASNGTGAPANNSTDVYGLKPMSKIAFTSASDPVKLIAHWVPIHRNALADQPQMRSIIDSELLYGLALKEDDGLLNGDGTNDSIVGLLNREGIQEYDGSTQGLATDNLSDNVRRAVTLCELAFYPSTGVVVHPLDWEAMELEKSTTGEYLLTTNVAVGAVKSVWSVPVVVTPAIAQGTFLTGAFGQAAQVYDREQANIRVSEHHADFFIRNAVVVLAEERLALTTPRPEGLVYGTFGANPSSTL